MAYEEMSIFTRTFDFIAWLLPMTNNFPRAQRHTMTGRLIDAAFDLRGRERDPKVHTVRRPERADSATYHAPLSADS